MNPTKNVSVIEIDNQIFERLCDTKMDDMILAIQSQYRELKEKVNSVITRWTKIKDKDFYFETKNKVLFSDTRKLKYTMLNRVPGARYSDKVDYIKKCDEGEKRKLEEIANQNDWELPTDFELDGFKAKGMSAEQMGALFDDESCPCLAPDNKRYLRCAGGRKGSVRILSDEGEGDVFVTTYNSYYNEYRNKYDQASNCESGVKVSIHEFNKELSPFEIIIENAIYPEDIDDASLEKLKKYHEISEKYSGIIEIIDDFEKLKNYIADNKIEKIFDFDFRRDAIASDIEREKIDMLSDSATGKFLKDYYDNCDFIRARIQRYDSRWYLADEGQGHWEFWEKPKKVCLKEDGKEGDDKKESNKKEKVPRKVINLKNGVVARNPIADVKHNAVVGIDFGTKSTIVVLQDGDEQIVPMRIGMADYLTAPEVKHFENPTVMQFFDLNKFLEHYNASKGRPLTRWDEVCVSHEAFENMIKSEKSADFASFVTDIKQWAAGRYDDTARGSHLVIKDKAGDRYDINDYMKLTDEDIDLVELYAYYIGLFINNMHTGIYLDYILSFPETFALEIREHIIESFKKGIKKSILEVVFSDENCEAEFRVREGSSEPAAYAACALEQFEIEPTDEGVFYGIFDFGGGTADFDYGIWKNAPEDEFTYNYVIKHYGSGGDKTLGGENILQLLAYYVFCDNTVYKAISDGNTINTNNLAVMRENKLSFFKPKEAEKFAGTEALINNSESALLNTKRMMEALRPIWEENEEVKNWLSGGKKTDFKVELDENVTLIFNKKGEIKTDLNLFAESGLVSVEMVIDYEMIKTVISERINVGIYNFFEGLKQAYEKWEHKTESKIHIFLAGNSSKSDIVMENMRKYMDMYASKIFAEDSKEEKADVIEDKVEEEITDESSDKDIEEMLSNNNFIIYPPLGTDIAKAIQRNRGVYIEDNDLMAPTGKTGVAFGLVMCREGSMIRVESDKKKEDQIKFNYYIGVNYRKNFRMIFDRNSEYGKWLKFSKVAAGTETFEFYYTELPEVVGGEAMIKEEVSIHKQKCMIDNVTVDAEIYFKFINPNKLEYVAASEEKIKSNEYMSKVYSVEL